MQATIQQKSYWPKAGETERNWYWVDLKDQVLGRASSRIAMILMGKHKATFTPSVDQGDFVVVTNVDKIRMTGDKANQKIHFHHTQWPGGARIDPYKKLLKEKPGKVFQLAVKRMLAKNRQASRQILRLKIYIGDSHPHVAQNPKKLELIK